MAVIVDPKMLTFNGITGCPFLSQPVITDVQAAIPLLQSAVVEMERRYQASLQKARPLSKIAGMQGRRTFRISIGPEFEPLRLMSKNRERFRT